MLVPQRNVIRSTPLKSPRESKISRKPWIEKLTYVEAHQVVGARPMHCRLAVPDLEVHSVAVSERRAGGDDVVDRGLVELSNVAKLRHDGVAFPLELSLVIGVLPLAPATGCSMRAAGLDPARRWFPDLDELCPGPGATIFEDSPDDRLSRDHPRYEVGLARDAADAFAAVGDVVYLELDQRSLRRGCHGGNAIAHHPARKPAVRSVAAAITAID